MGGTPWAGLLNSIGCASNSRRWIVFGDDHPADDRSKKSRRQLVLLIDHGVALTFRYLSAGHDYECRLTASSLSSGILATYRDFDEIEPHAISLGYSILDGLRDYDD